MKKFMYVAMIAAIGISCEKSSDQLVRDVEQKTDNERQLSTSPEADAFRVYLDGRFAHYDANPPGTQTADNGANTEDYLGEDHNTICEHIVDYETVFLNSTAPFSVSDCYPAGCANVLAGPEHRAFYLVLETYEDQLGGQTEFDFSDRAGFLSKWGDVENFMDNNWANGAGCYCSETEFGDLFSDLGITGQQNEFTAILVSKVAVQTDVDVVIAALKDVDNYIANHAILTTDEKEDLLGVTSILRHSSSHWHSVAAMEPWPVIALWDAAGYLIGRETAKEEEANAPWLWGLGLGALFSVRAAILHGAV